MTSAVPTKAGEHPVGITREEKEQELERILHSGLIREKTALYALLSYLGKHSLDPHDEPLKEYTIGHEALGKPQGYDPRLDPTVRVEIGKVRSRLLEYYQQHPESTLRLEIPKGGYDVKFTRVVPAAALISAPEAPEPVKTRAGNVWLWLAVSALLALAAGLLFFTFKNSTRSLNAAPLAPEIKTFWQPYLNAEKPILLVYSTPLFVRLDQYVYRDPLLNLTPEIEKDEQTSKVSAALTSSTKRAAYKYTGVGEAESIFLLTQLLSAQQAPLTIKRSSSASWDDLKGRQVILLGSPKNNPQFQSLPYQPKFDLTGSHLTNLAPAAGEPVEYRNVTKELFGEVVEAYALISVYPGLDAGTRLVVLACAANEGIAGAAEYVTHPDKLRELFQQMKLPAGGALPDAFQFIVKVRLNDRIPVQLAYVTHHVLAK